MTPVTPAPAPVDLLVDWELAARTAAMIGRPGPQLPAEQAAQVVSQLRAAAVATGHVAAVSLLQAAPGVGVLVVDRAGWARANSSAFRGMLAPVVAEAFERRGKLPAAGLSAVGSRVTGAEVGSLLGFLSSRVLGQFDPFAEDGGRLLLVAPNVVQVEQQLEVAPADFRLWVCLHEETHRVQFTAVPWLRRHLIERTTALGADLVPTPQDLAARLGQIARGLPDAFRNGAGLAEIFATPEQRAAIAQITATMSLLEGHADVVMDEVGPAVVPTVATIRERFDTRRRSAGGLDRLLRRMMGLDAKMRQYRDGASFVRGVQEKVGVDGFNAVWTAPQTLPTPQEIAEPGLWVTRVHG